MTWGPSAEIKDLSGLRPLPGGEGAWVGWLGYEAGRRFERMPEPVGPRPLPDLLFRRYEGLLLYGPAGWTLRGPASFQAEARAALQRARPVQPPPPSGRALPEPDPGIFLDGVSAIRAAIREGEVYQVNLARELMVEGVDPVDAFLRLRSASPADRAAFLAVPGGAIVSNSPERFLDLVGDRVESRPIKGTASLGQEAALEVDPKERAELAMIVDLVRNDLGRVCAPGSVEWGPRTLRRLPTLVHAWQAVRGRLSPGVGPAELIAATFPPGSVTGAPKVAAMELIRALEPVPRGVYTGAVGALLDSGELRLSVAIRTATILNSLARFHVGSGVVWGSDPERELQESRLKARALLAAL